MDKSRITAYFDNLLALLHHEKETEREEFRVLTTRTPLEQRIEAGVCWYPLRINESGYGFGSYPFLEAERVRHLEVPHQLSGGKAAQLFTLADTSEEPVHCAIQYVQENKIKLVFFRDELPDWVHDGKIGIQLIYDDQQYQLIEKHLQECAGARNNRLSEITSILTGQAKPLSHTPVPFHAPGLNDSQNAAVSKALAAEDIFVIHGPPGTGKTTTLTELIAAKVKNGEKVLVCCPSNAATDHITAQLHKKEIAVVRIGNISKINRDVYPHTLEYLLEQHEMYGQWKEYQKRALEYRRMAGKYKRNFGKDERQQRDLLYNEARELKKEADLLENYVTSQIIRNAGAVTCTLIGSTDRVLEGLYFDTLILDEAAQAPEPHTWVPVTRARSVILAGDPFQLPPTIKSDEAQKGGLSKTLIEKQFDLHPEHIALLDTQYRMKNEIMEYSNLHFYGGQLKTSDSVSLRKSLFDPEDPVLFIDTAGCGFDEETEEGNESYFNPGEAGIIAAYLDSLTLTQPVHTAIISPYKKQVQKLRERLTGRLPEHILAAIDTIDAFQGQERDLVIVSLVRSNTQGKIGFLTDYRRMNVAMTRARERLVIIGDSATLGQDDFYLGFIRMCEENGYYRTAWEWMTEF